MTAIVLAPFAPATTRFTELAGCACRNANG